MNIDFRHCMFGLLILAALGGQAQNLVPNWSFEEHTLCPDDYGQVERATDWHKSLVNNVPQYHTEYYNACGLPAFGVPSNSGGFQETSTGQAYVSEVTLAPSVMSNYRENIYVQLIAPLFVGKTYDVSFKVSPNDNCRRTSNNWGVKFSTTPSFPIDGISQVYTSNIISDQTVWTEVNGSFVADSAYAYVCLGNFFEDDQTLTLISCPSCSFDLFGYYLDDVCVTEQDGNEAGNCLVEYAPVGITPVEHPLTLSVWTMGVEAIVQFNGSLSRDGSIAMFDASGRKIRTIVVPKGSTEQRCDISSLAPGVYLLNISAGGRVAIQRFVKS
jgi:hypothetical protein